MGRNQCPFCQSTFSYPSNKINHIRQSHPLQLAQYRESLSQSSQSSHSNSYDPPVNTAFTPVESWDLPPISENLDAGQNADAGEEVVAPPESEEFPDAGRTLTSTELEAIPGYTQPSPRPHASDITGSPWYPFVSEREYSLGEWFVKHQISKTAIDEFFNCKWAGRQAEGEFRSTHTLRKKLDLLHSELGPNSWQEKTIEYPGDIQETFFYRDPLACIKYLFRQRIYCDDTIYAPKREYNEEGDRTYSDLYTADWWWELQVPYLPNRRCIRAKHL